MIDLTGFELDYIINEDIPLLDMTSMVLSLEGEGKISFICRENGIICGTEEVEQIFNKFGLKVLYKKRSGEFGQKGEDIFIGIGDVTGIHKVWKISVNILEYMSGIATKTYEFVRKAREVNPYITVSTTRKFMPFTKKLVMKSILVGGAVPHRVSISDTILIFKEHLVFKDYKEVVNNVEQIKRKSGGKSIGIEVETEEEAYECVEKGFDFVQLDKWSIEDIEKIVRYRNSIKSKTLIAVAGGINMENVRQFSKTGADIIVTSSLYWSKPLDIKVKIEKV
ncbi:ModD protein [Calditerrivibrio nitroreducens]|uniref:Putative pyrophosphorylase ModD n=1 Tax=Calditerrivibrio nitroreducens (strain DSM 19672 / NBRC 101217 / Yu37-1) TaxID=768670 RepID=E4TES6_CALNY|nr:ModD protein [Calditerrivibrio nitroreducens]ADR19433.1 modD protein [Calditerrivibrio nitroreducens DSM 19672]